MTSVLCFEAEHAEKYGIECAILLYHIRYWIEFNFMDGKHQHEGKTWTYASAPVLSQYFSFMPIRNINKYLNDLVKKGVLIKGNFNKSPYDRTAWYAFVNQDEWIRKRYTQKCMGNKENIDEQLLPIDHQPIAFETSNNCRPIPYNIIQIRNKEGEGKPPPPPKKKFEFGKHVKLLQSEYDELVEKYGEETIKSQIESMNDYISSGRGTPYKDYAAALRNWLKKPYNAKGGGVVEGERYKLKEWQDLALLVKNRHPDIKMEILECCVEFPMGNSPSLIINFTEKGFREQFLNRLHKMNIPTEGL